MTDLFWHRLSGKDLASKNYFLTGDQFLHRIVFEDIRKAFIVVSRVKMIAFKRYGCPKNAPRIEKLYTSQ